MYYTGTGLSMKKYNVHDGLGSMLLKQAGIKIGLITSDNTSLGALRGERLGFHHVYIGVWDKDKALLEICEKEKCEPLEVAYIGDDLNDLPIMKLVGFSSAPSNGMAAVRKQVDYVCAREGGHGAYREVADLILRYSQHKTTGSS
jgi:3-deoxy-D-manno-octulosonate 8-phosphate phosphatase (KDO 8-P phosphatase)